MPVLVFVSSTFPALFLLYSRSFILPTNLGPSKVFAANLRATLNLADLTDDALIEGFTQFDRKFQKSGMLCADDVRPLLIQVCSRFPFDLTN